MTLQFDLSNRRVLITGAGQGVGRGLADAFAAAGATVLVNDLRGERAEAVATELRDAGGDVLAVPFDVTDYEAVTQAITKAGPADILVNNAGNAGADGFAARMPFADTTPADWDPFLQVNLYGVLHCTRAALPTMVERQWGRVVTIVSRCRTDRRCQWCGVRGGQGRSRGIDAVDRLGERPLRHHRQQHRVGHHAHTADRTAVG